MKATFIGEFQPEFTSTTGQGVHVTGWLPGDQYLAKVSDGRAVRLLGSLEHDDRQSCPGGSPGMCNAKHASPHDRNIKVVLQRTDSRNGKFFKDRNQFLGSDLPS